MEAAADGNIYLLRWTTPAIIYAISPGGEVIRRFTVDPGEASYRPTNMHIAGNHIAVVFFQPQTHEELMKVVDLEGHQTATYYEPKLNGKPQFPMITFACFTENPRRFTFLSTDDNDKLELQIAKPQ